MNKFIVYSNKKCEYYEEAPLVYGENKFQKAYLKISKKVLDNYISDYNVKITFKIVIEGHEDHPVVIDKVLQFKQEDFTNYYESYPFEIGQDIIRGVGQIYANVYITNKTDATEVGITVSNIIDIVDKYTGETVHVTPGGDGESTDVEIDGDSITIGNVADIRTTGGYDEENNPVALKQYVDEHQQDLSNYYNKQETDEQIETAVGAEAEARARAIEEIDEKIPTKTSDLRNDSGFIDNTYHDSTKQNAITSDNKLDVGLVDGAESIENKTNVLSSSDDAYYNAPYINTELDKKSDSTTIISISDTTKSQEIANNTEYRCGEMTSLTISLPSSVADDFISSVVFSSGTTPTSFNYPQTIKWSGDDVSNGAFVPVASKRYNVMIWNDGVNINAISRGA